jgi:hypothetical protein
MTIWTVELNGTCDPKNSGKMLVYWYLTETDTASPGCELVIDDQLQLALTIATHEVVIVIVGLEVVRPDATAWTRPAATVGIVVGLTATLAARAPSRVALMTVIRE